VGPRIPIAVTCGDVAGIGPEVAFKAALSSCRFCAPLLVGPREVWRKEAARLGRGHALVDRAIDIPAAKLPRLGKDSKAGGAIAIAAIDWAIAAAKQGQVAAVVTAPVSKTSLALAGYDYPGQTEYFAEQCGGARVAMMLAGPSLRVVLVSTHLSLKDAIARLSADRVYEISNIAHRGLSALLGKKPRLGLCALNPHAGEGGKFGDEEQRILAPAVRRARKAGVDLSGPHPADTLFWHARKGRYDAVIVLFHDQGLIPLKLLDFDAGVNVTLGLPIVRTSPDHGTAFDIAGKGVARPTSMLAAIRLAVEMAG
jgi:4-hydroxythreonine-4-phosphate dehydrogenase